MPELFIANRRALLSGAAAAALAAASGCARFGRGAGGALLPPQFVAAIQAVGDAFKLALPALEKAGLSGKAAATAQTVIDDIVAVGQALPAASAAAAGRSALVQIEGDINAVAPLVAPFLAGVPYVGIAIAALPAIEALVNFGVSLLTPQAAAAAAKMAPMVPTAAPAPLDPQRALARLLALTGR